VWIKLDDNAIDNPKFYAAARHLGRHGHARAFAVYMAGLCYSNGHLTDGFVSDQVVSAFKCDRKPHEIALVLSFPDVRLWQREEGGFRIHDYHVYNPKAKEIKDKRARDAERKRLEREAKQAARPHGQGAESAALARARSRSRSGSSLSLYEDPALPRGEDCGNPVENGGGVPRELEAVAAPAVLAAIVWSELRADVRARGIEAIRDPHDLYHRIRGIADASKPPIAYGQGELDDLFSTALVALELEYQRGRFVAGDARRRA
jgi:hypothetical protein